MPTQASSGEFATGGEVMNDFLPLYAIADPRLGNLRSPDLPHNRLSLGKDLRCFVHAALVGP